ncbi:MAG: tubulin binding cofactor C-domain-containing protein [Linnemannia gamsii]|nr:MAG: tubulin binding cofactor C-domain-containing protein [Linnemannia gamsii]
MSEASREFRATFDPEKQSIEEALARLDKVPKDDLQTSIDSIVQRIGALEKTVTEKISILPPFEARTCMEASQVAIKAMSEKLAQLRVKLVPKAKFSFKSRKTAGATPSPTSTPKPAASPKPTVSTPTIDQSQFLKFEDRTGEHLFIGSLSLPESGSGIGAGAAKDVALTNLTDCTINLVNDIPLGAIHVKNLKRCTLVFPPVSGSILLHDCEGCTLVGACHQSRMHTSTNMNIYIHVTSEPIIEDSTDMRFAPYGQILPAEELDRLFEIAQLNQSVNLYDKVKDFNWLRQQQSPNWRLLEESELQPDVVAQVLSKDRPVAEQ